MTTHFDILVIEDEDDLRDAVVGFLSQLGRLTTGVGSVEEAEAWLVHHDAAIILLDLNLPGESGLDWMHRRPELKEKGIIMVTAAGSEAERIAGRLAGADGYFVKPVNLIELGMTVKNLLDRLDTSDHWQLDSVTWQLMGPRGDAVKVTASELIFLESLAMQPGSPVDRESIIQRMGENPRVYDLRRMEVLVRRLRTKVEKKLGIEAPIATVRSVGYAFTANLEWTGQVQSQPKTHFQTQD